MQNAVDTNTTHSCTDWLQVICGIYL